MISESFLRNFSLAKIARLIEDEQLRLDVTRQYQGRTFTIIDRKTRSIIRRERLADKIIAAQQTRHQTEFTHHYTPQQLPSKTTNIAEFMRATKRPVTQIKKAEITMDSNSPRQQARTGNFTAWSPNSTCTVTPFRIKTTVGKRFRQSQCHTAMSFFNSANLCDSSAKEKVLCFTDTESNRFQIGQNEQLSRRMKKRNERFQSQLRKKYCGRVDQTNKNQGSEKENSNPSSSATFEVIGCI